MYCSFRREASPTDLITDFNRLLYRPKCKGRSHKLSRYCLQGFVNETVLKKHLQYYSKCYAQHFSFPTKRENDVLKFTENIKQLPVGFVVYADLYCLSERIDADDVQDGEMTSKISALTSCGYGYQVVCVDDRYTQPPK